jgi:hypothetical protein
LPPTWPRPSAIAPSMSTSPRTAPRWYSGSLLALNTPPSYVWGRWPGAFHARAASMKRDGSERVLSSGFRCCDATLQRRRQSSSMVASTGERSLRGMRNLRSAALCHKVSRGKKIARAYPTRQPKGWWRNR